MKLRNYLLVLVSSCVVGSVSAQAYFTSRQFSPSGVNNEGIVVGTKDQARPYELWYPETGQLITIGGISAGNGVGGVARFSADGKKIVSSMMDDAVLLPTEFCNVVSSDYADFKLGSVRFNGEGVAYMVGSSSDKQKGIIFSGNSQTWKAVRKVGEGSEEDIAGGLVSIGILNYTSALVGGHNGAIYYTQSGGRGWSKYDVRPTGNTKSVATCWAIDFIPLPDSYPALCGTFGMEYTDGTYAVWQTEDGGDTLTEAAGVEGIPTQISHFADVFYMTTRNGHIQKSIDAGKTWTTLFSTEANKVLNSISFLDENVGMALGEGTVYITTDGGQNWNAKSVKEGVTDNVVWKDVVWYDGKATIVGSNNAIYETGDKGQTWTRLDVREGNENADLCSLAISEDATSVCGTLGSSYWKSNKETVPAVTAGIYDVETQIWTPMKAFGFVRDGCVANAYGISGNGEMVIGNIHNYQYYNDRSAVQCHAAIWTKEGEPIDLGSKFDTTNRMTRASAVSYDGSVIAGCQDIWGPWYASYWRRNPDGSYTQKLIFKDLATKEEDIDYTEAGDHLDMIKNCLGYCQAITPDGKWIGGRGEPNQSAEGSPWIWSEETGLITLGGSNGTVSAMNSDASVIVGWWGFGESPWIWTKEDGMMDLNKYAVEKLGADLKGHYLCSVYDMSPNGRYITGWCMKGEGKFGYMIDLMPGGNGVESVALDQCRATVYPNPVSDVLHIDFPYDDVNTNIRLLSLQGMVVKQMNTSSIGNTMDLTDVPAGLYVLDVEVAGVHKTFKIEVMH